jgi:hypothetical protein
MPTLHSHTQWQAPQADTQSKACQRVCLSHAVRKKLKISFPSKNFKNANPQTDTKTLGQLVAKLNIDKGIKTRTTRTPGHNSTYTQVAVQWSNQALCFYQSLCLADSESLRNRHLRVAAKRWTKFAPLILSNVRVLRTCWMSVHWS